MSQNQFTKIGIIQRTHGINGELQVFWDSNFDSNEKILESVFIKIDGIPIPFFISSIRSKGTDYAIIKFEDVDDIKSASKFENLLLLISTDTLADDTEDLYLEDLVEYTILSTQNQIVGKIVGYQDFNSNSIFTVLHPSGVELLIPANMELIVEVKEGTQTLIMQIPEGLLDLYFE